MKPEQYSAISSFFRRPFIQRVLLFVLAFVAISGLTGSWVISTKTLLFPFHFWIYGSAGKSLLFGLVVFLLLTKDHLAEVAVPRFQRIQGLFAAYSVISVVLFFLLSTQLLSVKQFSEAPVITILAHAALWLAGGFATFAIFGWRYLRDLGKRFYRELLASAGLGAAFYFLFGWIFQLWPYLSKIVLWAVAGMLSLTIPNTTIVPPLTIHLPQFAITIGEYCSGIESLFLITTLYILIGCLEWRQLKRGKYLALYVPMITGMFILNIIRVYVIIISGLIFGPKIAAKLFHTYLGMILFMGYFFVYWRLTASYVFWPKEKEKL